MSFFRSMAAPLVLLLSSGCVYIASSHASLAPAQPPCSPTEVRVFLGPEVPPEGFQEVAIVEGHGNRHAGVPEITARLRRDAAELGANALIDVRVDYGMEAVSVTATAVRYQLPP